jgi:methylmalonyl-CoA epimerase
VAIVDHVGWVVRSLDAARPHFETNLGLAFRGEEAFPGLRIAFFGEGPTQLEVLEPVDEGSAMGGFLASHGEGVHHLALRVDDVGAALDEARRNGLKLVDQAPRPGTRGTIVGFVDPGRPDGILIQYVQRS